MEDVYRTDDEIEILAESFATLSKRTRNYIAQITEITAEKERIGTELALATRIQADMLPNIFPAFPERPDFDIYATMTPAKEVGGDFYDFFLIDDTHLGLVMADVSGKGVPAALFMMISKILVQNYAMTGRSTAEVLRSVNEQICSNNREEMFVTVWFGILDTATGKITAANAGHEYPVIMQTGSRSQLIKDKHGFVIGGMEGIRYRESFTNGKKGWEQNRPLMRGKGRRSYCKKHAAGVSLPLIYTGHLLDSRYYNFINWRNMPQTGMRKRLGE